MKYSIRPTILRKMQSADPTNECTYTTSEDELDVLHSISAYIHGHHIHP